MGEVTVLAPDSHLRPSIFSWAVREDMAEMESWRSRVSRKYLFQNAVVVVLQDQGQHSIEMHENISLAL